MRSAALGVETLFHLGNELFHQRLAPRAVVRRIGEDAVAGAARGVRDHDDGLGVKILGHREHFGNVTGRVVITAESVDEVDDRPLIRRVVGPVVGKAHSRPDLHLPAVKR